MPLRCFIVDDNPAFVQAAVGLLEREGIMIVGTASNSVEALRSVPRLSPDVILVDIGLGAESGFDVARRLVELEPRHWRVIMISTHAESDFAELIDEAPVAGFVPKSDLSASSIHRLANAG